jgi:hypothetical protein
VIGDPRDALAEAARRPTLGPTTFGLENLSAGWDVALSEERFFVEQRAMVDAIDDRNDQVKALTGERLPNPMSFRAPSAVVAERQRQNDERLSQIRRQFPQVPIATDAELRSEIAARSRATFERTSAIRERATTSGKIGFFLGETAGIMTDPPMLATMLLGAPLEAGILRTAVLEMGINLAGTAAAEASNAVFREKLGRPITEREALADILMAGVGGFALGGLGKAIGRGVGRLVGRSRARAAAEYVARYASLEGENPGLSARNHAERFDAATGALREGRAVELGEAGPRVVDPRDAARVAEREAKFAAERARITEALPEGGDLVRAGRLAAEAAGAEADRAAALDRLEFMATEGDLGGQLALLRKPPTKQPLTLLGWLKRVGGIREDRGELKAIGISARTHPGLIGGRKARPIDERARDATEAGFFPEVEPGGRASYNDFLRALDDATHGRGQRIAPEHEELAALHERSRDAEALFGRAGIDVKGKTDEQVRAAIVDAAAEVRAGPRASEAGDPATLAEEEMARLEDDDEAGMLADEAAFMVDRIREDVGGDMPFDAPPEEREGALAASRFMLDEGAEKSGTEILDELDLDAAAIKAVEDCLL